MLSLSLPPSCATFCQVTMVRVLVEEPKGTAEGDGRWLAELTRDLKRLKCVKQR